MKKLWMVMAIATVLAMPALTVYAQAVDVSGEKLEELRKKSIEHFYTFYDADGDQAVSKEEFMSVTEKRFDEMDKDADGLVTGEEVLAHHDAMQAKMMKERNATIQQGGGTAK